MSLAKELSLAERLGYHREDRLLIVNCDDLGSTHSANRATAEAFALGLATDATLMVPCPWAREAVDLCHGHPLGLHLTLTSEQRGCRWRGLTRGASLHDAEGFLPATGAAVLERLDPEDARAECRAQIEAALGWGLDVTHLDAHMDIMLSRGDLCEVYLDLAADYRLPVRMLSAEEGARQDFRAREQASARGLLANDHALHPWPRHTRDVLLEELPRLAPGVTEIYAHPAHDGEELRAYDARFADLRASDARCLTDPAMLAAVEAAGVRLVSFRDLRELQRAA